MLFIKANILNVEELRDAVKRTVEWTKETGAPLGGVVNCAGVGRNELVSLPLSFSLALSSFIFIIVNYYCKG